MNNDEDRSGKPSLEVALEYLEDRALFWEQTADFYRDDLKWMPAGFARVLRDYKDHIAKLSQATAKQER